MFEKFFGMGALALSASLISSAASAVTIDTFDFTLSTGWSETFAGTPVADPGASLFGSFVGVVEPDALGTIALADLTTFVASFTDSVQFGIGGATLQSGLSTLTSFRYETLGGAGTFSFAQLGNAEKGNACVGFFSFLSDATCASFAPGFPGANAFILTAGVRYGSTPDLPTITLVSSVTTPPAVPEPASWALFGLGVVSLAFVRRLKAKTGRRSRGRREVAHFT